MNVVALIVTFNRIEKLRTCLAATLGMDFRSVVVVDNASGDGTGDWLAGLRDERLHCITLDSNIGGAGGFKKGAEYITHNLDCDWVVFYDDDAYPDVNLLNILPTLPETHQVFCCRVTDPQGNICGMNLPFRHLPHSLADHVRYALKPANFIPAHDTPCPVETVSFVGVIFARSVLAEHWHAIHDELFLYYDDLYFGYYLTQSGVNIRYSPEITFVHDISLAGRDIRPQWKVYYLVRNLFLSRRCFEKHPPFSWPSIGLRVMKYCWLKGQSGKKAYVSYLWRGIVDGLRQRSGMRH